MGYTSVCTVQTFSGEGLQSVSEEHSDDQVVPASPSGGPTGFQDQDTVNGVTERVEVCCQSSVFGSVSDCVCYHRVVQVYSVP